MCVCVLLSFFFFSFSLGTDEVSLQTFCMIYNAKSFVVLALHKKFILKKWLQIMQKKMIDF